MRDGSKSDRDTQVQFRMPAELHKQLRIKLLTEGKSMTDFFNEAARGYLANESQKSVQIAKGGD